MMYIGDYLFKSPTLLEALDIPFISEELGKYDVIHGGASSACYVLGLAKKLRKFQLIYDVHGCIEELLEGNSLSFARSFSYLQGLILEGISNKYADLFITCSSPLKDRLLKRGISQKMIEVVPNSVDTELFKPGDCPSNGEQFVVTYAGGFQKWQGLENLVGAAKMIRDVDVKFKIIGFRKEDQMLKDEYSHVLAGKAELIDSLSQNELVNQLRLSDILIIPRNKNYATQMAFPTKFAEYMAIGKPVIVTNVDETSRFVRQFNSGFVCEPSAESIARTIMEAKRLPSNTLLALGVNGRQLAESHFDRKIIAKEYCEFLHEKLPNY